MPLPPGLPSTEGTPLTSESRSHGSLLFCLVTDPLLATLSRELHPAWVGAVRAGQADVHAAEGHAAHCPVQAGALVLAAALEGLSAPIHHAAEDAWGAVPSCEGQEVEGEAGGRCSGAGPQPRLPRSTNPSPERPPRPCFPGRRQPRPPLTGADADPAVGGGAEVAEEPLVVVARVALGTELAQLLSADAAAAAAVEHQGDAGGAGGAGSRRALTLPAALLALRLLRAAGGEERDASGPPPGPRRTGQGWRRRGQRHLPG